MSVEEEEGAEMDGGSGKGGARKHVPSRYLLYEPSAGHSYLTGRTNDYPPSSTCLGEYLVALLAGAFARLC